MAAAWVGDMVATQGERSFMPAGMLPRQKRQRVAEDSDRHVGGAQMGGGGEAVGAGADDRDGGIALTWADRRRYSWALSLRRDRVADGAN